MSSRTRMTLLLDLGARATVEVRKSAAPGDFFDGNVLRAILELGRSARTPRARYELIPRDRARPGFALDASASSKIKKRLHGIPAPHAFVVSARLDEIGHGLGRFRLVVGESALHGRLERNHLDVELLRPLWGKSATVQGMVHFKSNGQARFIEARRISARSERDSIFETMPEARIRAGTPSEAATAEAERSARVSKAPGEPLRHVDPMILWGSWPGDEPIEELLAQLD